MGGSRTPRGDRAPIAAIEIVELPVVDNQFVHRSDPLLVIDPTDYRPPDGRRRSGSLRV
jgi:Biotin-lipoyl like